MKHVLNSLLSATSALLLNGQVIAKPNILFLFVDDLSCDAVGAYGNTMVQTPNIDRLAADGVLFKNAYNMGGWNGAISIASRAQLITGKYIWNAKKAADNQYKTEMEANKLLPQLLREAGYTTFMTGKWHIAHLKPEQLFDKVVLQREGGMPPDTPASYNRPIDQNDSNWLPWDTLQAGFWKGGKHWSEAQADVIIQYINENAASPKAHFMYCSFNAPHDPRQAPQNYIDQYPLSGIQIPANFLPEHPYNEQMGSGRTLRDEKLAPFPRTHYAVRKHLQEYYAIVSHLDAQIGRIMETLRKTGMDKNTLIVLASDNGLAVGQHGFMGKQNLYDHSAKVPLIVSGKGMPKQQVHNQLVYMQDIVPTLYSRVGLTMEYLVDFITLDNIIKQNTGGRTHIYGAFTHTQRMLRNERFKLYLIPDAQLVYLFDLIKDPFETKNLYGISDYNQIAENMYQILLNEMVLQMDPLVLKATKLSQFANKK